MAERSRRRSLCLAVSFVSGSTEWQIDQLATRKDIRRSRGDLPIAVAKGSIVRRRSQQLRSSLIGPGSKVFATGGIGGVHRGFEADVSADLPELAQTPITVVCSGAKIVLDLPRTRAMARNARDTGTRMAMRRNAGILFTFERT